MLTPDLEGEAVDEQVEVELLQAVALFVFVVAVANLASVMVARVLARSAEFGVRASLGAGGWRQFRLLWVENIVLAVLGALGGVGGSGARVVGDRTGRRVTAALVSSNFAVALAVAVTGLLLLQSYQRLAAVDPGFATDGVVSGLVSLPQTRYPDDAALFAAYERLVAELEQIPGVNMAAVASAVPLGSSNNDTLLPPFAARNPGPLPANVGGA